MCADLTVIRKIIRTLKEKKKSSNECQWIYIKKQRDTQRMERKKESGRTNERQSRKRGTIHINDSPGWKRCIRTKLLKEGPEEEKLRPGI